MNSTLYLLNVPAQLALSTTATAINQVTNATNPVDATGYGNVVITTQVFTNAPAESATFQYNCSLIGSSTIVIANILNYSSASGNPALTLSGQTNGIIYVTITNNHPTQALNGSFTIAVLVYQNPTLL